MRKFLFLLIRLPSFTYFYPMPCYLLLSISVSEQRNTAETFNDIHLSF